MMKITEVPSASNVKIDNAFNRPNTIVDGNSFSEILKNAVDNVNMTQKDAYKTMDDITTGKVANLQEAVQRIEEADLTLKLALETKNKALGAYKEIMQMPV